MTLEEELALIHKKPAPAPMASTVPAAEDPALVSDQRSSPAPLASPAIAAPKTREQIDAEFDLPAPDTTPRVLPEVQSTWDVLGAAWTASTVKSDAWAYAERKRKSIVSDVFEKLDPETQARVRAGMTGPHADHFKFTRLVLSEAEAAAQNDPAVWGDLPFTQEALAERVLSDRKTELKDAQAVLDQPGGGIAEFIGSSARELTRPVNVITAPIGGGTLTGWKFLLAEFGAGAFASAAVLPSEIATADELGIERPNATNAILFGGLTQAGLSGVLAVGVKYIPKAYRKIFGQKVAHQDSIAAATPEGGDKLGTEVEIDRAEATLRGEESAKANLEPSVGPLAGAENLSYNEGAVLRSIIGTESGGRANAKNPNSSATGLGQFIGSTWLAMMRKYRPDIVAGKTNSEILSLRDDAALSTEMTAMYTRENAATLQSNGIAADPGALYMAHFMGPGGAVKAMKAGLDTPISALMSPKEIAANGGIRFGGKRFADFTAGDLRRWAAHKMRAAYDPNASRDMPVYGSNTSRGYTGEGQVAVGDSTKIDVEYVVVDINSLTRASGDLQPRDRSRSNSDAWIADTAARLDPAQLMPAPTADRGAPIVGPDSVIKSGNGRFAAVERAYEYHPDRASAYRTQIEAAGFSVPDGVDRPILVARRKTDLTPDQRRQLVIDAQDSGVAVMTPTEVARASSRAMTAPVLGRMDPSQALTAEANGGFVRAALAGLPRSARNAMFDAGGMLNASGQRQLREAMFARAWNDPDIIEMFTEADQGELKSLMEALATAAPNWAALKADIEAGLVRPEMDISGHVLDAMRLIASARKLASREGMTTSKALAELLDDVDLIEGAVAPLTTALVRKFWKNGRAASADDVAGFLARYADDARKAGSTADMFGATTPRDVLRAIDKNAFASLPEDLGPVRGFARPAQQTMPHEGYDAGANSIEAELEDTGVRDALEAPPKDTTPASAATAAARADLGDDFDALEIDMPDGTTATFREILDDLDADSDLVAAIQACAITPGGA